MGEKIELPAVRDRDVRSILEHFELAKYMANGQLNCHSCSQVLTWDNLGALLPKGGSLLLFCHLSECLDAATRQDD